MNSSKQFRIVQTRAAGDILPFVLEEKRQVWYLPFPIWRAIKRVGSDYRRGRAEVVRFRNTDEARQYIDRLLAARARYRAEKEARELIKRQQKQQPRIIELVNVPLNAALNAASDPFANSGVRVQPLYASHSTGSGRPELGHSALAS